MLANVTRVSCFMLSTFVPLCTSAQETGAQTAAKPSRYKLHVGQELNYEGLGEFKYDRGALHYKHSWRLLVVRANSDGGWRLFVRHGMATGQTHLKNGETSSNEPPTFRPDRVNVAWCDLSPDGRIADNPTLGFHIDLRNVLPQLPAPSERSCQSENRLTGQRYTWSLAEPAADASHVTIISDAQSPEDAIYLTTRKTTFSFDTSRGLVDRIENAVTQGYGFDGKGTGLITLTGVENRDPNLATFVAVEMNDYFAVNQEYEELLTRAEQEPARSAELVTQAKAIVDDLRQTVRTPEISSALDAILAKHEQMAKYVADTAMRLEKVINKPSPAWDTTDLAGSAVSLEGCRGKVLVLDFWYRGCGWCVRAMPQVKQVAAHFQGRAVAVLGMNTDSDQADAQFVVDKLALNYPTLKAEGLPEKYGVRGFPTLLVIDQAGVVRDVHIGYSPTLAKSVIASVEKLLAATPPAAAAP